MPHANSETHARSEEPVLKRALNLARPVAAIGILSALVLCPLVQMSASASAQEPILEYRHSGTGRAAREFRRVMENRAVQRLLLEVASAPRSRDFIEAALEHTEVTSHQLEEIGLIRLSGDRYELSFSLLTRSDRERILEAAEVEGRGLAERVLARRARIEEILRVGIQPSTDWGATAYIILGCISLDWDGLRLAEEEGYLTVPGEGEYLPNAVQPMPPEAVRELYWGSHNYTDAIMFTTFGDHYSLPRLGLPDLLPTLTSSAAEPIGSRMAQAARDLVRRGAAKLMLQLRDRAKTAEQLASDTGIRPEDVQSILNLLLDLRYVDESDGAYRAAVPVLTERDRFMVGQTQVDAIGGGRHLPHLAPASVPHRHVEALADEVLHHGTSHAPEAYPADAH